MCTYTCNCYGYGGTGSDRTSWHKMCFVYVNFGFACREKLQHMYIYHTYTCTNCSNNAKSMVAAESTCPVPVQYSHSSPRDNVQYSGVCMYCILPNKLCPQTLARSKHCTFMQSVSLHRASNVYVSVSPFMLLN